MTDLDITAIREETCEPTWPRGMYGAPQDMYAAPIVKALRAEIARSRAVVERLQGELDAVHGLLSQLDLENSTVTREGTAWGSILREALAISAPVPTDGAEN